MMLSSVKEQLHDSYMEENLKVFEQQLPWSCGPSSLRTVLYHEYGIDLTDRELSLVCGVNENGSDEKNFMMGLKILGFKYKQSESGTLNKLKTWLLKGCLPIVHIVVNDGVGHFVVVCGFDKENIYLADPAVGSIVKYGIPFFMGVWKEEENETQTRWFLVVTGYTKNKIGNIIDKLKHIRKKLG